MRTIDRRVAGEKRSTRIGSEDWMKMQTGESRYQGRSLLATDRCPSGANFAAARSPNPEAIFVSFLNSRGL